MTIGKFRVLDKRMKDVMELIEAKAKDIIDVIVTQVRSKKSKREKVNITEDGKDDEAEFGGGKEE